jgi:L-ribulose-5-phosphate 3-epimerase UlaE
MYCLTFNLCRGYLGTGSVDFTGLFRGLAAICYSGPITFESFSSEVRSTTTVTTYLQLHKYVLTPASVHWYAHKPAFVRGSG